MNDDVRCADLVAKFHAVAKLVALSVSTLGLVVLIGWAFDFAALKSVLPELVTMKANTALGFLLAGSALYAADIPDWRRVHVVLSVAVFLLGFLTLGEYVIDVDLGIDQFLAIAPPEPGVSSAPGRMALATAVGFAVTGLALMLLDNPWTRTGAQVAAMIGSLIGFLAILGYVYDIHTLLGVGAYSSVAVHTAIGFGLINFGVFVARPQCGLMAVVTSNSIGGSMTRRLLPAALIAPFLIGWLRIVGEHKGLFSAEFGVALVAITYMFLFGVLIWRTGVSLHNIEQSRRSDEQARLLLEAQLNGMINSAMDAIIIMDSAQHITLFNPAAEAMFGRQAVDVLNRPLELLLPLQHRATHGTHVKAFALEGMISRSMGKLGSVYGLHARGEEFPIEASISKIDVQGKKFYTAILRDISERQQAEVTLQTAIAEAERANKAKSSFLAAASHDLRQPLSALALYVNVLKRKVGPGDSALVTNVQNCIGSLNTLLTDLLDLSKLQAGVVKPNITDFALADLLARVISTHRPAAQLKNLDLRCRSSRLVGRTDPVLYGRILDNLVANAVRYTRQGGVLIGCRHHKDKTWIEVRDTGIGIPAEKTAEIFEEFHQLNNDERGADKGSGLGLAIVAKSAALLGLEIRVSSRPGKGSLFAVELPLGREISIEPAAESAVLRPFRIALVDDNALVLDALTCSFENIGHQVVAALCGKELLVRLGELAPDVVVSDFRLAEGETGFDVITLIRSVFGNALPAIIITGDTDPNLLRRMADRGIVVQHKPLDIDTLNSAIGELLPQSLSRVAGSPRSLDRVP